MKEIVLSTGKTCPRCGCESLEEYVPYLQKYKNGYMEKHYHCVALCGMDFGLSRLKNGKIKIGYDKDSEEYLARRFAIANAKEGGEMSKCPKCLAPQGTCDRVGEICLTCQQIIPKNKYIIKPTEAQLAEWIMEYAMKGTGLHIDSQSKDLAKFLVEKMKGDQNVT